MDGLNKCQFIGNLGADPELKVTQGGTAILRLSLAASTSYLDRDNNRQERTEWVRATVFGKRAEGLAKVLGKGDRLYIAGEMRTSKYEKDGQDHYSTEIAVDEVVFCGKSQGGGQGESDRSNGGGVRNAGGQRGPSSQGQGQRSFDTGTGRGNGNGNGQRSNGGQQRSANGGGGGGSRGRSDDFADYGGHGGDDEIPF